ncbi:tetratricopeptide repeat protein [Tessaracoccus sp. Z1128]
MEPDTSARPGAPDTVESPADAHTQALLDFLAMAPGPLREWADARADEARAQAASSQAAPPWVGPFEIHDAADLALAELGEHDDEPRRRPLVHTPADKPAATVAAAPRKSGILVPLLGVLLVAAVVYGVFRMGLPADTAALATTQASQATATDSAARRAELEATLAESPEDVAANLELGVLTFNDGDVERAEQLWTTVTEVDPSNPQAWFNLGFVHLSEDPPDAEAARADWQKVLDVAPDSDLAATVRSHLDALAASSASPSPSSEE